MRDSCSEVDKKFKQCVAQGRLPDVATTISANDLGWNHADLIAIFDAQVKSRQLDFQARILKDSKQSFYTIGSSGHEGNAAVAAAFSKRDMAFLHYRSGAFMLKRAQQDDAIDMVYDILLSLVACSEDPIAAGRHKVFGSLALNVPPQTSTIASHLPKAVGFAFAITRAKELALDAAVAFDSVVLCNFGDASLNHSTAQGAINTSQWLASQSYPLPLVYVCEDNGLGISVRTPQSWIETSMYQRPHLHYIQANGLHVYEVYAAAKRAYELALRKREPVFLHLKMVRLLGHAGSDIETVYLTQQQILANEANDPLLYTANLLLEEGVYSRQDVLAHYDNVAKEVAKKAAIVIIKPKLTTVSSVMASIIPRIKRQLPIVDRQLAKRSDRQLLLPRNMSQNINLALADILLQYPTAVIFGEDVGIKGGVYNVTANLQKMFGQRRVFDTLLDEQTILGHAIGMAMNGFLPIAEIQFLAYVHNAIDQIRGEAATLSFFSSGQFTNPMIIRIPALAYQKGFGGHFHNDNSLAALLDIPGVMLACPSNGLDAAKMLRTCIAIAYAQHRVVIFIEPIALYMVKDALEPGDQAWLANYPGVDQTIAWGEVAVHGEGKLSIVSYANGYYLARRAAARLYHEFGITVRVIDIRWLAPLPEQALLTALAESEKVLIVDECRRSGSLSERLITLLYEQLKPRPELERLTAEDSFIPLGDAWQCLLPSEQSIFAKAIEMLDL